MMRFCLIVTLVVFAATAVGQESALKSVIPDDAAQKAAMSVIADVYKPDQEQAKTPAAKIELAKKLLSEAINTKDDAVSRFVLFRIARDMAAQQGELAMALEAIHRMELEFQVDQMQMQLDAAQTASKALKLPADYQTCAVLLAPLIDKASVMDHYDMAKSLSAVAVGWAKKSKDAALLEQLTSKSKKVQEIAAEFVKVKAATINLKSKPTDPETNLAVGRFLCFFKGDWERGVTMLALSNNEQYKAAAALELEDQPDPLTIGDSWWKIAESLNGTAELRTKAHAAQWYRKALPSLSGLSKARIERLIASAPTPELEALTPTKFTNSIGMKLVLIRKGTFLMGSPKGEVGHNETQHEVTISQDYYLGMHEVTQDEYEKVLGQNPSQFKGLKNPVERVSWNDAVEFCKRLSELPEEKKAGRVYRLPTEAEWEYACRAGSKTAFSFGENSKSLGDYAWHNDNSGGKPHPVGEKKPNAWGLYDMYGNVWEWSSDWYGDYPKVAVTDPGGPRNGSLRVLRGSGWRDGAALSSANRGGRSPAYRRHDYGFRVALSPSGIPK